MQLRFTKRARTEFLRIVDVYAEYAGQRSAGRFIDKMKKCSEEILKYPTAAHPEMLLAGKERFTVQKRLQKTTGLFTTLRAHQYGLMIFGMADVILKD